jgi:hypothetical protein
MRDFDDIPKPTDLMDHPQLAVLVALRASLVGAMHMLLSVHTDLLEDTFPRTVTEQDYWAERLIDLGRQLEMALTKYRAVVREEISICQEDFF